MPAARRGQAATCWLVELGNGDKFLFDIGSGSAANIASLNIPYDYLDKVFVSHLHADHIGDMDTLWVGGWTGGRHEALNVWWPSGATPTYPICLSFDGLFDQRPITNRGAGDHETQGINPGRCISHPFHHFGSLSVWLTPGSNGARTAYCPRCDGGPDEGTSIARYNRA